MFNKSFNLILFAIGFTILSLNCVNDANSDKKEDTPDPDTPPEQVYQFATEEQIKLLEEAGIDIHYGIKPPTIIGKFLSDNLQIIYDDENQRARIDDSYYSFYDQKADGTIKLSQISLSGTFTSDGIGAFISGNDQCASVWLEKKAHSTTRGQDCNTRSLGIVSTCLTEDGNLTEFYDGFILLEREGDCQYTIEEGHRRILNEKDNLLERVED